jgi:hypothetical protein
VTWRPYTPLLDHKWGHDREWERGVVEAIRRGEAAPRTCSIGELVSGPYVADLGGGGWEHAESHAKDAIRTGSVFLNDEAIAARAEVRKAQRAALAAAEAENRARVKAWKKQQADLAAERDRQDRLYRERVAEHARRRAAQNAEWGKAAEGEWAKAQAAAHERAAQVQAILRHGWLCADCKGRAAIWPERGGFSLGCPFCSSRAWGTHEEALAIMEGR